MSNRKWHFHNNVVGLRMQASRASRTCTPDPVRRSCVCKLCPCETHVSFITQHIIALCSKHALLGALGTSNVDGAGPPPFAHQIRSVPPTALCVFACWLSRFVGHNSRNSETTEMGIRTGGNCNLTMLEMIQL